MARKATRKQQPTATIVQLPPPFSLNNVSPVTKNQTRAYKVWNEGKNLFLTGSAGCGKTFLALYLALREIRDSDRYKKIYIVRSVVPSRDIGALPGGIEEKTAIYEAPYFSICEELYDDPKAYQKLKGIGTVQFVTTSFLRGITMRDCIVIVDEHQNMNYGELSTVITRLGNNVRVIFCGDVKQTDLTKDCDRKGLAAFEDVIAHMPSFEIVDFFPEDIVRGGICREFLLAGG